MSSIGIDLGTTNSVVAIKTVETNLIPNVQGKYLTPSCVRVFTEGTETKFMVGQEARLQQLQFPEDTVSSVKRIIGRLPDEPDVERFKNTSFAPAIGQDPEDPGKLVVKLASRHWSPDFLSSKILESLSEDAKRSTGGPVESAVVTVPAYFNDQQKYATKEAVELAGLKLVRLLPEPTAAAISYYEASQLDADGEAVLVFDLGGGTFDISLLNTIDRQYLEIAKGGDMWTGGDDIDQLIFDHVLAEAGKEEQKDLKALLEDLDSTTRLRFINELRQKSEEAKIALCEQTEVVVDSFGVLKDKNGSYIDIDVTLTRADFEKLIAPLVDRLVEKTKSLLEEVSYTTELIDRVILVGGSSQIPLVQKRLAEVFGEEKVHLHPSPMFAIAQGAAILAFSKAQAVGEDSLNVTHATSHAYYLATKDSPNHLLIDRHVPLPFKKELKVGLASQAQCFASVRVSNIVDGVSEQIGELWLSRWDHFQPDEFSQSLWDKNVSWNVVFEIGDDNILSIQAARNSKGKDGPIFMVRGNEHHKIYRELETILRAASTDSRFVEVAMLVSIFIKKIEEGASYKELRAMLDNIQRFLLLSEFSLMWVREFRLINEVGSQVIPSEIRPLFEEAYRKMESFLKDLKGVDEAAAAVSAWENAKDDSETLGAIRLMAKIASEPEDDHNGRKEVRRLLEDYSIACTKGDQQAMNTAFEACERELSGWSLSYYDSDLPAPTAGREINLL